MRFCKMVVPLGAGALLFAMICDAAAQTIRHDVNGQTQTYDFKQQGSAKAPKGQATSSPRQQRPLAAELPRGPKNIPWDEPGKISGVPGVLENSSTDLPNRRAAAKNPSPSRRARAETHIAPAEAEPPKQGPARIESSPRRRSEDGGEAQVRNSPPGVAKPAPSPAPRRETPDEGTSTPEMAKARSDDAEARAKIIAEATARARAEEQRRLELERSKDRHARRVEPQATGEATVRPGETPSQPDPASTGAIGMLRKPHHTDQPPASNPGDVQSTQPTAFVASDEARSASSSWKDRVCKTLFFGALPGC